MEERLAWAEALDGAPLAVLSAVVIFVRFLVVGGLVHRHGSALDDYDRRTRVSVPARGAAWVERRPDERHVGCFSGVHPKAHALLVDPELARGAPCEQLRRQSGRRRRERTPTATGAAMAVSPSRIAVLVFMASSPFQAVTVARW